MFSLLKTSTFLTILVCFAFSTTVLNAAIFTTTVSSSLDDAEQSGTSNNNTSGNTLDMNNEDFIGTRFLNVTIPKDSTINTAYIQFKQRNDANDSNQMQVTISGEDVDNAADYSSTRLDQRVPTSQTVIWTVNNQWTGNEQGPDTTTTDIKTIIDELVSRTGWSSGNAMSFLFQQLSGNNRRPGSYDRGITYAPILYIDYTPPPASVPIGDYRFDSCDLTTMLDNSGYNNHGTLQNINSEDVYPRHEETGMVCRAGRFYSFSPNYATAGQNLQTDANNSFSISFGIEWSGSVGDLPIITKSGDYALKLNAGKLFYKLAGDVIYQSVPNFSITQNVSAHVAFIVTNTEVKIYKDAILTDTIADTYTHVLNNNTTYIGTDDTTHYFAGLLDEIKFYTTAINTSLITQLAGRTLRPCACCPSTIKIKGDYIQIGDTYDTTQPAWDAVTYNGFTFDEPPLLFMLPSDNGGHSAYIRARNVTENGFEAANIEPQGEDGPHIAMDLSYIAVNRGVHDLGEYTLESCTVPVQTEQFNYQSTFEDVNITNQTSYGTEEIECDSNGCWTRLNVNGTYNDPVVFATIITAENELRADINAAGRELSRPWMTVAIKNDYTTTGKIWVSLERSETSFGTIDQPEQIAYMITEGNIQSSFLDDFDNNVSYETVYVKDRFLGYNKKDDVNQRFNFVNTYGGGVPLVMANKQSRKDADGGWFRLNGSPQSNNLRVSIWEDRIGSHGSESTYTNSVPIGFSPNQDNERARNIADDGAAIVFGGTFQYAESFLPTAGSFDVVEQGANFNTVLHTKIVNKPFQLKYWSLDKDSSNNTISKVISSPVKVDLIYSQNPGVNLDCNDTTNLVIPTSTKYEHFKISNNIDNVTYNILDSTAYRNVQARFTYAADSNGSTADWTNCYALASSCGDTIYTSSCTAICTANGADSQACTECFFNNVPSNDLQYSCSYDRFAIRPDTFEISIDGSTATNQVIKAGISFQVDSNATTYSSSNAALDYNASQDGTGTPSQFHIAPTDLNAGSGCVTGLIIDIDDNNFTSGIFNDNNGKYTEIGDINITVFEDPNKVFASVDTGNSNASLDSPASIYTIGTDSIKVKFLPDHFDVVTTVTAQNNNHTYLSRDLENMSATLDINITARNDLNNTTVNYNSGCYAKNTSYVIAYNPITILPANHLSRLDYNETNTSTNGNFPINTPITLSNMNASIFTPDNNGTANLSLNINFDRDTNESVNPFNFSVSDINVTDQNATIEETESTTGSSIFIYGRTNTPRSRFSAPVNQVALIYYEAYCAEAGCTKSLLPNGATSNYVDDPRWFTNTAHVNNSGTAGDINQKNFGLLGGHVVQVTAPGGGHLDSVGLTYDTLKGYPYKTTMENNASSWLIYNKYDPNDLTNEFEVEFTGPSTEWVGKQDTNTTTDRRGTEEVNRRSMW